MKTLKTAVLWILYILLITGCSSPDKNTKTTSNTTNPVNQIINEQIGNTQDNAQPDTASETESASDNLSLENNTDSTLTSTDNIDYDLTQMSSDMVYATIYQIMTTPGQYEGKTFRIEGTFYPSYYEATQTYYFYCIIQDATACCAQGLEFVWEDGSHNYPEDYPTENSEILVDGTFESYQDEGDDNVYCRLSNAKMTVK